MVYLILVIIIVSVKDIMDLKFKNSKKDLYVYVAIMLLVCAFGIFYYSDPERISFSKIMLSLIGKGGGM